MRALILLAAAASTVAVACSTEVVGTAEPEPVAPPVVQPLACVPRDATLCDGLELETSDAPARDGAIAWAQVVTPPTAEGRAGGTPKVALYEDGTLRRTSFVRNLTYYLTPPRGLALATVAPSSMARVRADVAAIEGSDLRAFFGPTEDVTRDHSGLIDLISVPRGRACLHAGAGDARSSCAAAAVTRLRDDLSALAAAAEVKWRDAQSGTVSIDALDVTVEGRWPLADDRAFEGSGRLTNAEWSSVGRTGLYQLTNGGYVQIQYAAEDAQGGYVTVFSSRMTAVTLGDDLASLRAELLANGGRYALTHGEWLGIPLGADLFPTFKNRDLVIIPGTGGAPARLRWLYPIETLDLRAEGDLALP
jgi:hypothetical protein